MTNNVDTIIWFFFSKIRKNDKIKQQEKRVELENLISLGREK